jgi:hypothetical protein
MDQLRLEHHLAKTPGRPGKALRMLSVSVASAPRWLLTSCMESSRRGPQTRSISPRAVS